MIFADAKIHAKKFPNRYYRFGLGFKARAFRAFSPLSENIL